MKIKYHIAFSAFISGILHMVFKSWIFTFVSFLSGILIDIDHFIDYLIEFNFRFDLKEFLHIYSEKLNVKTYICLHSWELLFILLMTAWLTGWNLWITGTLIGFGQHILLDHFNKPYIKWLYSFLWRREKAFIIPSKTDL
ncbi:MAG: hypothetical protein AB1498_00590 [bacterium]